MNKIYFLLIAITLLFACKSSVNSINYINSEGKCFGGKYSIVEDTILGSQATYLLFKGENNNEDNFDKNYDLILVQTETGLEVIKLSIPEVIANYEDSTVVAIDYYMKSAGLTKEIPTKKDLLGLCITSKNNDDELKLYFYHKEDENNYTLAKKEFYEGFISPADSYHFGQEIKVDHKENITQVRLSIR
ncbi:MAG: hypothetical protein ACQESK_00125 [Bacteroidota bacterium]